MSDNYEEQTYNPNARLVILKALAQQNDYRLNDALLLAELNAFAINRGKGYLRNQLAWLEAEACAIKITRAGSAFIAELTENGLDHIERRQVLSGIARPSPASC